MRQETKFEKINERIRIAVAAARDHGVYAEYDLQDNSVQAELRHSAHHSVCVAVDEIHIPKCLDRNAPDETRELWREMRSLDSKIRHTAERWRDNRFLTLKANARSQTGQAKRQAAYLEFGIEQGQAFLSALKKATSKRNLEAARREISRLQQEQKNLLPALRRANSEYLAERKQAKAEEHRRNTEALESGRFWEASRDALKDYFHPPFKKNHLADVSERWRACLFVECESTSWKAGRDWRHKMVGTERAYLCGIDDNGDEWGHECSVHQHVDQHGNLAIEGEVEQAMAELFEISSHKLSRCSRQGDLLFCPVQIPENTELYPQDEPWEVMESHTVSAPGLLRNGRHFRAESDITITHTSHHPITLPAGSYRLYTLQAVDAD